jgi:predicted oxidoreductase
MTIMPGDAVPDYVERGDTVGELAQKVGIDPEGLKTTVKRFNEIAAESEDHDFQRGKSAYDKYYGDRDHKPNPSLGPLEKPPFYALPTYCGSIGTKGGPVINTNAQVLHISGKPIPGLYAAGNAAAPVSGPSYWGAGGTIGPAMTFGYLAGRHVANKK